MKITFLGDMMLDADQREKYRTSDGFCFDGAFSPLRDELSEADFIVANLETPVAGEELLFTHERYSFNAPIEFAEALKKAGVGLVTTANNHSLDRGMDGLERTIENLDAAGLPHTGTQKENETRYFTKEICGHKIGFIACTYGTNAFANGCYLPKDRKYCINLFQEQELHGKAIRWLYQNKSFPVRAVRKVLGKLHLFQFNRPVYERREFSPRRMRAYRNAMRRLRQDGAEFIFALLHTGGQYNERPTPLTKWICRKSLAFGADCVIANHEHVVHGFDRRGMRRGRLCFYSLGNCFSSSGITEEPFGKRSNCSAAVSVEFERGGGRRYSITILSSVASPDGKITVMPMHRLISACGDETEKRRLLDDYSAVMNAVFGTRGKAYPPKKEHVLR